MLLTIV